MGNVIEGRYTCTRCGEEKLAEDFYPLKRQKRNRDVQYYCKVCERDRHYQRKYGISASDFDDMVRARQGRCNICGRKSGRIVLDHNHATGTIRGILCNPCNKALYWVEREGWLDKATAYLEKGK